MKSIATILITAVILCFIPKLSKAETALEHMEKISECIDNLKKDTWQYLKSVTKGKGARKVEKNRQDLLSEIKSQKIKVKSIPAYKGDSRLKDAVVVYLDLSYTVLKEDFDKILDMEDIAEQSYDAMEAYITAKARANVKLDSAFQHMDKVYRDFAAAHDIKLIDSRDKMAEKIEKSNEVLEYYNEIYLIFFKCYKQEAYVMDALLRNDVSGVEQNSNTLKTFCKEALNELHNAKSYRGDGSLKVAAKQIIKFYQDEATSDFPAIVDFYLKKDNFEKIQKAFEAKSKKSRTQADVDKLNNAGKEYNEAIAVYNKLNEGMNSKRTKFLTDWNTKSDKFFDLHTN